MKKLLFSLTLLFVVTVYGQFSIGFEGFHFNSIPGNQFPVLKYDGLLMVYNNNQEGKISTEVGIGVGIIEPSSAPEFLENLPIIIKGFYSSVFDTQLISSIGFRVSKRIGFLWLNFSKLGWFAAVCPRIYIRFNSADVFIGGSLEVELFGDKIPQSLWSLMLGVNYTF